MAVEKRIEMNPDGGISVIFEDKDGSGDLNRIMGELCERHRQNKIEEVELLQPMSAEEEDALDLELDNNAVES